jgi:hypothetical protein
MRIGIKKKVTVIIGRAASISDQVFTLMERQGEQWAARRK